MTKEQFLEKHNLTERDYNNLIRYEEVRKNSGINMYEYIRLMRNFNVNGGERLAQWIIFKNNYAEFLEMLNSDE